MNERLSLITILLWLPGAALAADESNPYSVIVRRNAFGLKPPLEIPAVMDTSVLAAKVKLVGIAAAPSEKWAILEIQESNKPAAQVRLKEGANQASVKVLTIDVPSRRVFVRNAGALLTLTFQSNGAPVSAGSNVSLASDQSHRPIPTVPLPGAGDP